MLYKISDKTNLLLQGDFLKSDYTPDFGVGTVGNRIPDIRRGAYLGTNWAYNKTNTTTGQINLNHEFSDNWKINVIGSVQGYNRSYFSSERPAADGNGVWYRALTRSRNREFTYNQQVNLNGSFKTGKISHTLLAGADADQSSTTSFAFTNPNLLKNASNNNAAYYDLVNILDPATFDIPSNFNMPQTDMLSDTYTMIYRMGAFVQDLISITDQFKVLAGIRYTFQKTPSPLTTLNTTGVKTPGAADKIDKAWSPKVGLIYQPIKTTSLYASYSNNLVSNSGTDIYLAALSPSIIDQYEVGIKNDLIEGKLSANVTGYRIKNDKFAQQALFLADGTPNGDTNIKELNGQTTSDGVEIDLTGTILPGLNFIAGYSYNFMRYTQTRDYGTYTVPAPTTANPAATRTVTVGGTVEGERLVGTTKNTANGTIFYTFGSGAVKGLKLGASAFYTGKRNGGFNTSKIPPTPTTTRAGLIPVDGFTTLDFTAGYSWRKLSLLAKISNITDELNYYVHENYSINPNPPRQFMTTLSYKF